MKILLTLILTCSFSLSYGQDTITKIDMANNPESYSEYVKRNLKYPESAKKDSIEGRVIVEFQISKKGKIINEKIKVGVRKDLDDEALRFVRSMPDWEPGKDKFGRPHVVKVELPIMFNLK